LCAHETVEFEDFSTVRCDAHDPLAMRSLIGDLKPQWIIHCPSICASSWDECRNGAEEDHERTARLLAEAAREVEARLTVLSTDAVFSGPRMFHEERSPAVGATSQAESARRMEAALEGTQAFVVRTHAYGFSPVLGRACFAEKAHQALESSTAFAADGLRHATPILASDLAELLARAYDHRLEGLYHISGAERTSPFRFVRELAAACGLRACGETLRPAGCEATHDMVPHDGCAGETSMNSRRARRVLEIPMPLLREGLGRFAQQASSGWRDRLESGAVRALRRAA
jgi:dTDP-4-dehydrorhamnose reductase